MCCVYFSAVIIIAHQALIIAPHFILQAFDENKSLLLSLQRKYQRKRQSSWYVRSTQYWNSCKTAPLVRPNLMQISLHTSVDAHTGLASGTSLLSINLDSISHKLYWTFFYALSKKNHISGLFPSIVHI